MGLHNPMAAVDLANWLTSPAALIAGLALLLTVVYWILTRTITAGITPDREEASAPEDGQSDRAEDSGEEWDPDHYAYHPTGPDYTVEAIRIGEARISLGDTASHVVRSLVRGQKESLPAVERAWPGRASRVMRTYDLAGATVTFDMDRDDPEEPLRVRSITLHTVS